MFRLEKSKVLLILVQPIRQSNFIVLSEVLAYRLSLTKEVLFVNFKSTLYIDIEFYMLYLDVALMNNNGFPSLISVVRSEKKISSCCLAEDGEKSSDFVPIF